MAETTLTTANKIGLASSGEAAVGSLAALALILVLRRFKVEISYEETAILLATGPVASSYLLGALRHWWKSLMDAFQRGVSNS